MDGKTVILLVTYCVSYNITSALPGSTETGKQKEKEEDRSPMCAARISVINSKLEAVELHIILKCCFCFPTHVRSQVTACHSYVYCSCASKSPEHIKGWPAQGVS